jgi:ssDNA-binding Zn-finger/Zn-ribbon topoisomerase 1
VKIKHKSLRVEDADWDVTDEEAAAVKAEMFLDPKNNYNSKEEWAEITGKVEEEGRRCPECGSPLVHAAVSTTVSEGVGQTYAQSKMRPFTVFYDVVCPKCGLVLGQSTKKVHR